MRKRKKQTHRFLTPQQLTKLYAMANSGCSNAALAQYFGVCRKTVRQKLLAVGIGRNAKPREILIVERLAEWVGEEILRGSPHLVAAAILRHPILRNACVEQQELMYMNMLAAIRERFPQPQQEVESRWLN